MLRSVATLLAAAVPLAAGAFDWSARVGVDYSRDDRWAPPAPRETYPRLDLNLGLEFAGAVYRADVVSYDAALEYRRLDSQLPSQDQVQSQLLYRGQLWVLRGPMNPLQLSLQAVRTDDEVTIEGAPRGASAITTQWGATLRYVEPSRPGLALGYTHTTIDRDLPTVGEVSRTLQTVTGGILEGTGVFSYNARYRGNFSEGDYATDEYADHRVDLSAMARVGADWSASISDSYYRRDPSASAAVNPRQEYNSLSAAVTNDLSRTESQRFTYRYSHGVQDAPAALALERTSQRLEYRLQKDLRSPEWRLVTTADVSHQQDRRGLTEQTATGETVGALLYWRRPGTPGLLELRGGPSVGYVQPLQDDPFFGWGAMAGAIYETNVDPVNMRFAYSVDFRKDLRAQGQLLTQYLSAGASRPLRSGLLTGSLQATATRFDDPLFGDRLARSISADAGYRWATFDFKAQLGLSDSVNPALDESVAGDGLLVAPYDSHSRYFLVNGVASLTRSIRLRGQLRFSGTDMPDRPSTTEAEGRGAVEFNYGALWFSIEDRYTVTTVSGNDVRSNLFLVRLYRAFGSRI